MTITNEAVAEIVGEWKRWFVMLRDEPGGRADEDFRTLGLQIADQCLTSPACRSAILAQMPPMRNLESLFAARLRFVHCRSDEAMIRHLIEHDVEALTFLLTNLELLEATDDGETIDLVGQYRVQADRWVRLHQPVLADVLQSAVGEEYDKADAAQIVARADFNLLEAEESGAGTQWEQLPIRWRYCVLRDLSDWEDDLQTLADRMLGPNWLEPEQLEGRVRDVLPTLVKVASSLDTDHPLKIRDLLNVLGETGVALLSTPDLVSSELTDFVQASGWPADRLRDDCFELNGFFDESFEFDAARLRSYVTERVRSDHPACRQVIGALAATTQLEEIEMRLDNHGGLLTVEYDGSANRMRARAAGVAAGSCIRFRLQSLGQTWEESIAGGQTVACAPEVVERFKNLRDFPVGFLLRVRVD